MEGTELRRAEKVTQILVVGGGLAGISAALSAAREGKRVILMTDRPVLGGSASSEIRVGPGGADHSPFNLYARESGIVEEVFNHLCRRAANAGKWRWFYFDQIYFDLVLSEPNIELLLNTTLVSVRREGDRIFSADGIQLRSETRYSIRAEIFVDATGDGTLGALAGNPWRMGRESRAETGERYAPERADGGTMGSSLLFTSVDTGRPVEYRAPDWAVKVEDLPSFPRIGNSIRNMPDGSYYGFWWVEYGGRLNTIYDDQRIMLHLRALVMGIWDYIKNSGNFPGAETQELNWIGYLAGKRESRRLEGLTVIDASDLTGQRSFDDAIGYTGWPIDIHPPAGYLEPGPGCTHDFLPGVADIPFSALVSVNIGNLMFAGRHISCTHEALGSLRLISTTSVMGQAVGTASALCLEEGILPADIPARFLPEFRRRLARRDQSLIGYRLLDPGDLTLGAEISASSVCEMDCPEGEDRFFLKKTSGLVILGPGEVRSVTLFVGSEAPETVTIDLYEGDPAVRNYRIRGLKATHVRSVRGRAAIKIPVGFSPAGAKLFLFVRANPRVYWLCARGGRTGILPLESDAEVLDDHSVFGTIGREGEAVTPCFSIDCEEKAGYYAPERVKNGYQRPYGGPNLWRSAPFSDDPEPWIQFDWGRMRECGSLELVLNPDFNRSRLTPRMDSVDPNLIRSFAVEALTQEGPREILRCEENFLRFLRREFPPVLCRGIRLRVLGTWGSPCAEIFDLRVFG